MNQPNPILRKVGSISFMIALLLGILLIMARSVPDMESTMYGFIKYGYPRLTSLSCPVLMTSLDRLPAKISLHNSLDRPLSMYINAQLSSFVQIINAEETIVLQPGETRSFSWDLGRENIDLQTFVFARVFTSAATSAGMREATCGTLVLNLPFKGGPVIFYICLALFVITGVIGLWLLPRHSDKSDPARDSRIWWIRFVALVLAIGVIAGIFSWWFLGIVTLLLTLLTSGCFSTPK